ncbi:hypothetical protein P692DRAFT_201575639 [Suillus brevipes Sb2]|nr:hypothetical protein P692DRAFT_201575639 [Suillus brevipes Sb2]
MDPISALHQVSLTAFKRTFTTNNLQIMSVMTLSTIPASHPPRICCRVIIFISGTCRRSTHPLPKVESRLTPTLARLRPWLERSARLAINHAKVDVGSTVRQRGGTGCHIHVKSVRAPNDSNITLTGSDLAAVQPSIHYPSPSLRQSCPVSRKASLSDLKVDPSISPWNSIGGLQARSIYTHQRKESFRAYARRHLCVHQPRRYENPSYLNIVIREICNMACFVVLLSHASLLSQEIRASFELGQTLDHGELIRKFDMS